MKKFFQEILFLSKYIYRLNARYSIYSIISSVIQAGLVYLPLVVAQEILDSLIYKDKLDHLIYQIVFLSVMIFLLRMIDKTIQAYLFAEKKILVSKAKDEISKITQNMTYAETEETNFRDFLALADEENCFTDLFQLHSDILLSLTQLLIFLILLGKLSVFLFVISLFVALMQIYIQSKNIGVWEKWKPKYLPIWRKIDYYFSILQDIEFGKEVRVNHLNHFISKAFEEAETDHVRTNKEHLAEVEKNSYKSEFLLLAQQAGLFIILGYGVVKKRLTVGDFSLYLASVERLNTQLMIGISAISSLQKKQIFIRQLMTYNQKVSNEGETLSESMPDFATLEFRNVWFRYPHTKSYVLQDFNLLIKKGETLAIVGVNGSGKSTIVKLLAGLYRVEKGDILYNGHSICQYDVKQRQSLVSVLFQNFRLFSISVEENIISSYEKNKARLNKVLDVSGLRNKQEQDPFFLTRNIEREFDKNGFSFSGGERQRMALARTLYKPSKILVLDEPTATLDAMNEAFIQKSLFEKMGDRTGIFVTHRFILTQYTQKIAVIQDGQVKEYGDHKTLMKIHDGIYHSLFRKQQQLLEEIK